MARRFDRPQRGITSLIGGALLFATVGLGCGGPDCPVPPGDPSEVTTSVTEPTEPTPEPPPPPPPRPPTRGEACDPGEAGGSYRYLADCNDDRRAVLLCADDSVWRTVSEAGEFECYCEEPNAAGQVLASCAVPGFVGIGRSGRNRDTAPRLRAA